MSHPDSGAILRPTWVPFRARHYRRPGGPWRVADLDTLLSARSSAVVDGEHRLGAEALEALVARVAGGLAARGAKRGRAVTWQLPNGLAAAVLYRACWRLGAVAAPLLHSLGDAEREAALGLVDPAVTLDLSAHDVGDPDRLAGLLGGTPVPAGKSGVRPFEVAVVLFTSGSAGAPKAVLHTHRGLSWKASLMAGVHGLGNTDTVLMPAPLSHISGLLNGVLLPGALGMKAVMVRRFDPAEAVRLVAGEQVTFLAGPPTFFVAMAGASRSAQDAGALQSVRLISTGGAAVTPALVESTAASFGCRVKRTYGSTEAPTITTSTDDDPAELARDTDGRAVGEAELRVADPDTGVHRTPGQPGELWVRGPELFAGYVDRTQTAMALARGGWFRTGDLATVDGDGWLRVVGRLKDVIIRGGENISATEVEGVVEAHPRVHQAVAVGYPDDLMGERVAVFVVADAPFDLTECGRWFADRRVARFKTPEQVVQLRHLPLLGSGKPDRARLRELAAKGQPAEG